MSKCLKPFTDHSGRAFGCGQCLPCRVNKQRIWTHRILLEAAQYEDNSFVTLTYDDKHLPEDGSLVPLHLRNFLDFLRKGYKSTQEGLGVSADQLRRFRFFAVGEYGDQSGRPHYHLVLFNFPSCGRGITRYMPSGLRCCVWCHLVHDTWGKGRILCGSVEAHSAAYVCGYVCKKLTKEHPQLGGRHPEFSRQSNRPGIGADAMHDVASVVLNHDLIAREGDVPSALRHGKKVMPLGPYLTRRLRKLCGEDEKAPQAKLDAIDAELLPLRYAAKLSKEEPSLRAQIEKQNKQKGLNLQARMKIRKPRGSI